MNHIFAGLQKSLQESKDKKPIASSFLSISELCCNKQSKQFSATESPTHLDWKNWALGSQASAFYLCSEMSQQLS